MVVDVLYEGLALARGANAREEGKGVFIELEAPMPVGTRLTLRGPDGDKLARVERVKEGASSGVEVRFVDVSEAHPAGARQANAPAHVEPDLTVRDEPREPEPADKDGDKRGGRKEKRGRQRRNTNAH
jgi:hypothetical protein